MQEIILLYKKFFGKKGSLPEKKLANEKEPIAALEEAIQKREAVHEQPYLPPQNWRIASRPQRTGGRSATGAESIIADNCKAEWKDDYSMVEYCTNEKTGAKNRLDSHY